MSTESLQEIAHKRLFPPLTDPSYLVLRARRKILKRWFDKLPTQPLDVLDVGGRYQPYRPLLAGKIGNYVAVDVSRTEFVSVVADGQALPFAPESFDVVIATQVFEYFQSPAMAAQQMHSVLRSGGVLIASVAAFTPRFDPKDRWRFLPCGVETLLAPFKTIEIVPEVCNFGGLLRAINVGMSMIFRQRGVRSVYRATISPLLNMLGVVLEALNIEFDHRLAGNYSIRATK